jgi:hypothetical protein
MVMATRPLQAITATPVLVKSSDHLTMDGVGTLFLSADNTHTSGLHVVTNKEAFKYLDTKKGSESRQIAGNVARFRQALRDKDWHSFKEVHKDVWRFIPHLPGEVVSWSSRKPNWKRAAFAYSEFMGNLLHEAQFIMWCSMDDEQPRPGLYCPNWDVAAYAVFGMDGVRRCAKPGCRTEIFVPKQPTQDCCCPAHSNARRVARWRAKQ